MNRASDEEPARYTRPAMWLHWLVAILVLVASGLALFREAFGSVALDMIALHKVVGLVVLAIVPIRLAWRWTHRPPPLGPHIPTWEARIAGTAHRLLYALLIIVPLAGWLFVSLASDSRPLDYRGPDNIPRLPLGIDDDASFGWHEAHELAGFALIGLMLVHISGVARHQWLKRDRLLERMAGPGVPRGLAGLTLGLAALWALGLSLDFFDIRLFGDPPVGSLEPVAAND